MNCLDGQIGVIGLSGYTTTKSGLYINDLPGLTLNQLDKIKDDTEDYLDAASAWARIYTRAKKNLELDVIGANRKHFKRTSIISSRMTGQIGTATLAAGGVRTGHYFDFTSYSKSLEIFFNSAQLYFNTAGTTNIEVYDATMGVQLETTAITATEAGLVTVALQSGYSMLEYPRLFVCYDDTGLDIFKAVDHHFSDYLFNHIRSISTASTVLYGSLASANTGLILNYNVKCGILSWICQNIDVFIKPLWYKLGVEWLNERFGSDRINRYTMIGIEEARMLKEDFQMEYKKSLDDILQTMHPTEDGFCFECNKQLNKKYMLP